LPTVFGDNSVVGPAAEPALPPLTEPLPMAATELEVIGLVGRRLDAAGLEEPPHPAAKAARPHTARIRPARLRVFIAASYLGVVRECDGLARTAERLARCGQACPRSAFGVELRLAITP
jgi:hypothetical protein